MKVARHTGMEALALAVIIAGIALPIHFAMKWQLDRLCDPRHIRSSGVAIAREEALEGHAAVIGHYAGHEIYAWVQFMGMRYRFDRIARRSYRHWVGARELFLEPGLVYVTD